MVDHVDSMFHYFKRNLGYNIYKRLDQALAQAKETEGGSSAAAGASGAASNQGNVGGLQSPSQPRNTRSSRRLRGNETAEEPLFLEVRNIETDPQTAYDSPFLVIHDDSSLCVLHAPVDE